MTTPSALLDAFIEHWQLAVAAAAGIVYTVGYLRASRLLRTLRVDVPPTEIYAPASLFVSGIAAVVAALAVPLIVLSVTVVALALAPGLGRWPAVTPVVVAVLAYAAMPRWQHFAIPGFQVVPVYAYLSKGGWVRFFASISLGAVVLSALVTDSLRLTMFVAAELVWFGCLMKSYAATVRDISVGLAPGQLTQDPVVLGYLVSEGRVAAAGELSPEFGAQAFETGGILLSRRDGVYYFLPGTYAQEVLKRTNESRLVMVPASRVITFLQDPGVRP